MSTTKRSSSRKWWVIIPVAGLAIACSAVLVYGLFVPLNTEVKSKTEDVLTNIPSLPDELTLATDEAEKTFTSPTFEADFAFNAIAPMWQEKRSDTPATDEEHHHIEMRVSNDNQTWTDWLEIDAGTAQRDDKFDATKFFPETPLFIEGRHFQYRMTLERDATTQESPTITDLQVNYIDSRPSLLQKISASLKDTFASSASAATPTPPVISRAAWGSPDPYGDKFKGTDDYWIPSYAPTKQIFLHHTVSANSQSDPKAIIRGIWNYHAVTLDWGDIGYNYLLDHQGNIYEGRLGGDNVTAGHVRDYNKGSLGVAVLGCFQPNNSSCRELNNNNTTPPTPAIIEKLAILLSWKTSIYGINPDVTHTFCKFDDSGCISIPTIAAHRQALSTSCNGQLFYDKMNAVRQKVVEKNSQNIWGVHHVEFMQKSTFGTTQQLFYGTNRAIYSSMWGAGGGIATKTIMQAPVGERFVDLYKLNRPDGTTQSILIATQSAVYEVTLTGTTYSAPAKLIEQRTIKQILAEIVDEGGTDTYHLYLLADDGPYEYQWEDPEDIGDGLRLWNINHGIDMVKQTDPDGLDELYVATKSEVYRMKWPVNGDIDRRQMTALRDTVGVDKQTLPGGTELLYTATKTGVHETWWKPGTGLSNPAKLVQTKNGQQVVDVHKTITNGYHQLYVAENGYVREYWWGPNSGGVHSGQIIHISQNTITEIGKSTNGAYQNLYTASQSFIFETWWGKGKFGNGPAIVQVGK